MATLPEQCCTLPPTKTDYKPLGKTTKIIVENKEYDLYTAGPADSKYVLVGIYGAPNIILFFLLALA